MMPDRAFQPVCLDVGLMEDLIEGGQRDTSTIFVSLRIQVIEFFQDSKELVKSTLVTNQASMCCKAVKIRW